MRGVFWMLLIVCLSNADVGQRVGIVLGLPETVDLRYGIEFSNVGLDVTPGLGMFVASKLRDHEVIPISWNPTLRTAYILEIKRWFSIKPNLTFMYFYGWGGMIAQTCTGCSTLRTRFDALYFKESLAAEFKLGSWAIEINPGFTQHKVIERTTSVSYLNRINEDEFKMIGFGYR
jgi:hypothetical protein